MLGDKSYSPRKCSSSVDITSIHIMAGISKSGKTYTNLAGKRTAVRGANKTTNGYGKNSTRGNRKTR